jgi:hypothetical protein
MLRIPIPLTAVEYFVRVLMIALIHSRCFPEVFIFQGVLQFGSNLRMNGQIWAFSPNLYKILIRLKLQT